MVYRKAHAGKFGLNEKPVLLKKGQFVWVVKSDESDAVGKVYSYMSLIH